MWTETQLKLKLAHSPHSVRSVLGTRPAAQSLHSLRACMLRSMYSSLPLQGLQDTCFQPVDLPLPSLLYWVPAGHRQSAGRQGREGGRWLVGVSEEPVQKRPVCRALASCAGGWHSWGVQEKGLSQHHSTRDQQVLTLNLNGPDSGLGAAQALRQGDGATSSNLCAWWALHADTVVAFAGPSWGALCGGQKATQRELMRECCCMHGRTHCHRLASMYRLAAVPLVLLLQLLCSKHTHRTWRPWCLHMPARSPRHRHHTRRPLSSCWWGCPGSHLACSRCTLM